MEDKIKELLSKISVLQSRTKLIDDFLNQNKNELPNLCDVKSRIIGIQGIRNALEKIWEDFSSLNVPIEDHDNFQKAIIDFEEFFQRIYADLIYIQDVYDKDKFDASIKKSDNLKSEYFGPKIPRLAIEPFDGTPTKWLTFKESCEVVFHNNENIDDVHKFVYLKKHLKGDALAKIEGIHLTNVGYKKAWEELCHYYDGSRFIVESHIESLLNIRPISKDSFDEVNLLLNTVVSNVSSLEANNYSIDNLAEIMIVFAVSRKFSVNMKREWEKSIQDKEIPSYRELKDFLEKTCRILKSSDVNRFTVKPEVSKGTNNSKFVRPQPQANKAQNSNRSAFVVADNSNPSSGKPCVFCNEPFHPFVYCPVFLKMSVNDRLVKIKSLKLCLNCFGSNHMSKNCSKIGCKKCKGKHHSLLHYGNTDNPPDATSSNHSQTENSSNASDSINIENTNTVANHSTFCVENKFRKPVLLSTALVLIRDKYNRYLECRALIDQGSQSNFISADFVTRFPFDKFPIGNMRVGSLNQNVSVISEGINSNIKSRTADYTQDIQFLVVNQITDSLPQHDVDISRWHIPRNIVLSDPYFNTSKPIDIILGAEVFYDILLSNRICIPNLPTFQETLLGWLVGGKYEPDKIINKNCSFFVNTVSNPNETDELNKSVERFWELESIPSKKHLSKDEEKCEKHFSETHTRDISGRYVVNLPLKENHVDLGDSKDRALKRFHYLENRLYKNPQLKSDYTDFINDYINLGHMKLLKPTEIDSTDKSYYLPHHAVFKPSSSTTKLRVVFDASMKTSTDLSLNDVLLVGPTVQQNLFSIVLRFRKFLYALTSDISKMYRQVVVNPSDTPLQRILWRPSPTEQIQTYELTTVTYGTAAAPYLATRALKQLSIDEKNTYPIASSVLENDFYVDDVLTGAESIEEAKTLQSELISLLSSGGFHLHKWASNSTELLENIRPEDREILKHDETSDREYIGTLGLFWKPREDVFVFRVDAPACDTKVTKRSALSTAAKLFDPLGLVAPTTIIAKLFIQQLWKIKADWDDPLPSEFTESWLKYLTQLPELNKIQLPRCVVLPNTIRYELHGFADASQQAYGCCVYLKSIDSENRSQISLLCSKSRVAPLKTVSLPRLELCAALLLSELIVVVIESIDLKLESVNLWSDSLITLQWLKIEPSKLKVFVANRVSQIVEHTAEFQWRHVRSEQNPADVVSRGIMPSDLQSCDIWWNGPDFIKDNHNYCGDKSEFPSYSEQELELKKESLSFATFNTDRSLINFDRFSSFNKYVKLVAYIFRWRNRAQSERLGIEKPVGAFSVDELDIARNRLICFIQKSEFKSDYDNLSNNKTVDPKSKLKMLNPFVEPSTGLIRVGGRLSNADLSYDVKHQIILPKSHNITDMLFRQYHLSNMHAGTQLLISSIRQLYWPIAAKCTAKKIIRTCIPCFRYKPIIQHQIMGSLPSDRTEIQRPFRTSGVDLCGPFFVKNKLPKNSSPYKVYVACFVCFLTKAVHLEILSDLSAECFIACLTRCVFRRGRIATLWSDNATNFVGANNQLKKEFSEFRSEIVKKQISDFCVAKRIKWRFIPPRAPNFGGLWESAIKSLKFHLKRVTAGHTFTFEELYTLIVQVEGILNSRPLTPCSDDPADPTPLTPGHFLVGEPLNAICEPSVTEIPFNRLSSWKGITKITQSFWKRFSNEYFHTLQERKKWKTQSSNLEIGDVVLIAEDNLPSACWLMGRIVNVYPGHDGKVRVVEVKTKNGIIKRSISKIAKLPIDNNDNNEN